MSERKPSKSERVQNAVWAYWTKNMDLGDPSKELHARLYVSKAIIDSYVEGMTEEEWLRATLTRLEFERGGTLT